MKLLVLPLMIAASSAQANITLAEQAVDNMDPLELALADPLVGKNSEVLKVSSLERAVEDQNSSQETSDNADDIESIVCESLDLEKSDEGSSLVVLPEEKCDLGLNMIDFSGIIGGFGGFNVCSAVQSITSEAVDSFNDEITGRLQDVIDDSTEVIEEAIDIDANEVLGNELGVDAGSGSSSEDFGFKVNGVR